MDYMQILHFTDEGDMQKMHFIFYGGVQMTKLKEVRIERGLTQQEAAARIGISLRSYVSYENDETKTKSAKYRFLISEIEKINLIDEEHGILSIDEIAKICNKMFLDYKVEYCYLFGSYAKGKATEISDVDLLISTKISGLKFYELVERLREELHKKVDVLDFKQLLNNEELLNEVLKDGVKIYG